MPPPGPVAIDIALAAKIANLSDALESGASVQRRKLAHYEATIAMGDRAAQPALASQATRLLVALAARSPIVGGVA